MRVSAYLRLTIWQLLTTDFKVAALSLTWFLQTLSGFYLVSNKFLYSQHWNINVYISFSLIYTHQIYLNSANKKATHMDRFSIYTLAMYNINFIFILLDKRASYQECNRHYLGNQKQYYDLVMLLQHHRTIGIYHRLRLPNSQ